MERLESEHFENPSLSLIEHQHRYKWASTYAKGAVCDIACGSGYGSEILLSNDKVNSYIGIDIDSSALEFARNNFGDERISFFNGSAISIPLANNSVDTIISMETIEHLESPETAIKEFRRILKNTGILIGSVPSKTFEEKCEQCYGPNKYHLQRFTLDSLRKIVNESFTHVKLGISMVGISTLVYPAETNNDFAGFKTKTWLKQSNSLLDGSIHFAASEDKDQLEQIFTEMHCMHGLSYIEFQKTEMVPLRQAYKTCEELVGKKDNYLEKLTSIIEARDAEIANYKKKRLRFWK